MGGVVCDVTPVISTTAYSTGDQIGGVQELKAALGSESGAAIVDSIAIIDQDNQKSAIDIFFFSDLPTPNSVDNGAVDFPQADLLNLLGVISVQGTDYAVAKAVTNAVATVRNLKLHVKNTTANIQKVSIWAVAVARGTPTYTSTDRLKFRYGLQ
jgi:hypothetical protein